MQSFTMNNSIEIPAVGLGTFRSQPEAAYTAVAAALAEGYRHIDTAAAYGNEQQVGQAIIDSKIPREEIFITTKLWNSCNSYDQAMIEFDKSMAALRCEYLDLYLIHWPGPYERITELWSAMEDMQAAGKIKTIGVSNFNVHHIDHLMKTAKITPAINQIECHIGCQNHFLQDYCSQKQILLQAYAPLMSQKVGELVSNEKLIAIGNKYGKSPAHVALKWLLQRGIVILPKSVTPERIRQNIDLFDFTLDDDDMTVIRGLNRGIRLFPEPDNIDYGFYNPPKK